MTTKPFSIALPPELLKSIEAIAEQNDRSRNAQIVHYLKRAVAEEINAASPKSKRKKSA